MGVKNFRDVIKAFTRAGLPSELVKLVVEVAPQFRAIAVAFAPDLAAAVAPPVAAAVVVAPPPAVVAEIAQRKPLPKEAVAAAPFVPSEPGGTERVAKRFKPAESGTVRSRKQTEKGAGMAAARERAAAEEIETTKPATSKTLPGAHRPVAPLDADVDAAIRQLPVDTPMSLFFDGWGSFYATLLEIVAAVLADDNGKAKKGCIDVLARCEDVLVRLPPMTLVKFLLAAPLDGEHGTAKVRHEKSKLTPEQAKKRFEAAVLKVQKTSEKQKRKVARKALANELKQVFPLLEGPLKNDLRQTVLHFLIETLKEQRYKFRKMAQAQIVRTSDEDGSFEEGSLEIHFIVTGDGDAVGANCQSRNDSQIVAQIILKSRTEFAVRNARAVKAAIGRELFPRLKAVPVAWWSRAPGAVDWKDEKQVLVWLLSVVIFSWSGMCDFCAPFRYPDCGGAGAKAGAKSGAREHVLGIRMFCGRLMQWLVKPKYRDRLCLSDFYKFVRKHSKPGVLGHLVRSPEACKDFLSSQCRAAVTVVLQPVSRMGGAGWEEALDRLGVFFGCDNMPALRDDVLENVVCSARTEVVWSGGVESSECLGAVWPLPSIAPLLVRLGHAGGQRVAIHRDGSTQCLGGGTTPANNQQTTRELELLSNTFGVLRELRNFEKAQRVSKGTRDSAKAKSDAARRGKAAAAGAAATIAASKEEIEAA